MGGGADFLGIVRVAGDEDASGAGGGPVTQWAELLLDQRSAWQAGSLIPLRSGGHPHPAGRKRLVGRARLQSLQYSEWHRTAAQSLSAFSLLGLEQLAVFTGTFLRRSLLGHRCVHGPAEQGSCS